MSIRAEPDERSVKRLGARPARAQRQQKDRSSERPFEIHGGVYGVPASPSAKADPSLASSVGRIPKNVPLARFLNGIPPHRFEPRITNL